MTPRTLEDTVRIVEDAIAFTKAAHRAGLSEPDARRLVAELGDLSPERIVRICTAAAEQRRDGQAAVRRHNERRRKSR